MCFSRIVCELVATEGSSSAGHSEMRVPLAYYYLPFDLESCCRERVAYGAEIVKDAGNEEER